MPIARYLQPFGGLESPIQPLQERADESPARESELPSKCGIYLTSLFPHASPKRFPEKASMWARPVDVPPYFLPALPDGLKIPRKIQCDGSEYSLWVLLHDVSEDLRIASILFNRIANSAPEDYAKLAIEQFPMQRGLAHRLHLEHALLHALVDSGQREPQPSALTQYLSDALAITKRVLKGLQMGFRVYSLSDKNLDAEFLSGASAAGSASSSPSSPGSSEDDFSNAAQAEIQLGKKDLLDVSSAGSC